jgi:hypothetical protein
MEVLRRAAEAARLSVWTWSLTRGLARDGFDPQLGTRDPRQALAFIGEVRHPDVFVFADARSSER